MNKTLKIALFIAAFAPAAAFANSDISPAEMVKAKELSDNISAVVLGACAGLNLKTKDEQIKCINDGFDAAQKALEKARIEAAAKRNG